MEDAIRDNTGSAAAEIPHADTGIRILLTIFFAVVVYLLRMVLIAFVLFELAWALILQRGPNAQVRDFANRVIAYQYRIFRYMTYNEPKVPFPFSAFPAAVEPTGSPHEEGRTDVRALLQTEEGA